MASRYIESEPPARPVSLWLHPGPVLTVDPRRWTDYPYFLDALAQMAGGYRLDSGEDDIPALVAVRWRRYGDFVRFSIPADDEDEAERERAFIGSVAGMIQRGDDVPPLVRLHGQPADGTHRAWAAQGLGIRLAPTIEVGT